MGMEHSKTSETKCTAPASTATKNGSVSRWAATANPISAEFRWIIGKNLLNLMIIGKN